MDGSIRGIRVCHLADLPPGESYGFKFEGYGSDDIFLVNRDGKVYAYKNSCPHWPGSTLPLKKNQYLDEESRHIICRGHGALFDIETGLCFKGACVGKSLTAVPIEITESGYILI
ncbi:Rieske [2Fe-2S] domain protein [compost metagenome]